MTKQKTTIDDLASMMKKGFDSMDEQFKDVRHDIAELKTGQEDIKLRLDQAAYRFEMQALEKHAGIEPSKIKQR